jgi:hypothetical protein
VVLEGMNSWTRDSMTLLSGLGGGDCCQDSACRAHRSQEPSTTHVYGPSGVFHGPCTAALLRRGHAGTWLWGSPIHASWSKLSAVVEWHARVPVQS